MPKLAMPGADKPKPPPVPKDTRIDDFRKAWQVMVNNNRAVEAKAAEIVALVEGADHTAGNPLALTGDDWRRFLDLEYELVGLIYNGQRHIWHTTALASRLGERDRPAVESKVGPLFTEQGALAQVWRDNWLNGRQLSRASVYRRLLRAK